MPGEDPIEFIRNRDQFPNLSTTRIIAVTADDYPDTRGAVMSARANGYLTTPFTLENLKQTLTSTDILK
jgi:CheY-like chemotaxis protein